MYINGIELHMLIQYILYIHIFIVHAYTTYYIECYKPENTLLSLWKSSLKLMHTLKRLLTHSIAKSSDFLLETLFDFLQSSNKIWSFSTKSGFKRFWWASWHRERHRNKLTDHLWIGYSEYIDELAARKAWFMMSSQMDNWYWTSGNSAILQQLYGIIMFIKINETSYNKYVHEIYLLGPYLLHKVHCKWYWL